MASLAPLSNRLRLGSEKRRCLCALVIILVFEGFQNDGAASPERTFASEIEAVKLGVSENIIVIQAPEEPQADGVSTHRSNLRDKGMRGWAVVGRFCRVACPIMYSGKSLESVRRLQAGLHSFLSMRRIDARRKNAKAFRLRHSQSLDKRRQRLSHAMVRSIWAGPQIR
jgi:hypothetical protein